LLLHIVTGDLLHPDGLVNRGNYGRQIART